MAAPITKSLAQIIATETVGIPTAADKILYSPLPNTPFVTDCKAATVGSLFTGGGITDLVVSGHAAIGPQATIDGEDVYGDPASYQVVNINETIVAQVSPSGIWFGGNVILTGNPAAPIPGTSLVGWGVLAQSEAGNVQIVPFLEGGSIRALLASDGGGGFVQGLEVRASKTGNGNLSGGIAGISLDVEDSGTGTAQYMQGIYLYASHDGAGLVAALSGLYVDNGGASGPVTNAYGIYVEDFSALAALPANSYNLYSKGATSRNRFEGSVLADTFIEGSEIADPAAPAANKSRLYTKDNGAGKTQLVVRFPTGAVQVIATEP